MKVSDQELYARAIISQNILYIDGEAYKIVGYDYETKQYELVELEKVS